MNFCSRAVILQVPVNFTNVLRVAFTRVEDKSARDTYDLTVFFAHLGSGNIKAASKHVGEIYPSGLCVCGTSWQMGCTQDWCDEFCSSKNFPKGRCNPKGMTKNKVPNQLSNNKIDNF
jgi:hypothetical protein